MCPKDSETWVTIIAEPQFTQPYGLNVYNLLYKIRYPGRGIFRGHSRNLGEGDQAGECRLLGYDP